MKFKANRSARFSICLFFAIDDALRW
jgi:hypothetical protein